MTPDELETLIIGAVTGLVAITVAVIAGVGAVVAAYTKIRPTLKQLSEGMAVVRHEVQPNSGKSIKDAVDRMDRRAEETDRRLDKISRRQEADFQWQGRADTWMKDTQAIQRGQAAALSDLRETLTDHLKENPR